MQEIDLHLEKSRQSLLLLPGSPPRCSRSESRMRNDARGSRAPIRPGEKGGWHLPAPAPQTPTHSSSKTEKKGEKLGPRQLIWKPLQEGRHIQELETCYIYSSRHLFFRRGILSPLLLSHDVFSPKELLLILMLGCSFLSLYLQHYVPPSLCP